MKIKLYFGKENVIRKSGIGRAKIHQEKALELNCVDYTTDKDCLDYDILHINTVFPDSVILLIDAKKNNKKVIYHAHSTEEDFRDSFMFSNALSGIFKKWLVFLYSKADYILTPTIYSKQLLENKYNINVPIKDISNGVDIDQFTTSDKQVDAFCKNYNITHKDIVIISVGWLFERKGFDTFVDVARLLPEYKFIWFGDIQGSRPTLKIQRILSDLPSNVILPGYVSGDIIKGAYGRSDVFFFPSREETEGIVVLEAFASKCNVLVRDIPVFDPWLVHGKNCLKGSSVEEFVNLIQCLVSNEFDDIAYNGYLTARDRNLQIIGSQLKEVYNELIK